MTLQRFIFLLSTICVNAFYAQPVYDFTITTTKDICLHASASLEISGRQAGDTSTVLWSTGQANTEQVYELLSGDYSVNIKIKHHQDSLLFLKDTTLYFSIEKELCGVAIDKYFSPNDDNYHDRMGVINAQYHPNFELNVFNKWGQQVHSQKKEYTPWDGKWNGLDLPDGTYYYIFFYDATEKNKLVKGDVTILR